MCFTVYFDQIYGQRPVLALKYVMLFFYTYIFYEVQNIIFNASIKSIFEN